MALPSTERGPQYLPEHENQQLFSEIQERLQSAQVGLILDVDESLVLSVERWTNELNHLFTRLGCLDEPLSYEEVCAKGGTQGSFGKHPDIRPDWFARASQRRLNSLRFNRGLPPVEDGISDYLSELTSQKAQVGMYLTARPDSMTDLTAEEMQRHGFPDAPVLAKPDTVANDQVSAWKYDQLRRVAENSPIPIVMVDDSVSMADYIESHRTAETADEVAQRIYAVVYKGARTNETNGHRVVTWATIAQALQEIGEQSDQSLR